MIGTVGGCSVNLLVRSMATRSIEIRNIGPEAVEPIFWAVIRAVLNSAKSLPIATSSKQVPWLERGLEKHLVYVSQYLSMVALADSLAWSSSDRELGLAEGVVATLASGAVTWVVLLVQPVRNRATSRVAQRVWRRGRAMPTVWTPCETTATDHVENLL
jgi:hypothetical protein